MEFSKHLGKGLWGIADKVLPVLYGVAYVVLVIRVLPEEEFGNFVLIQEIFLITSGLAMAFSLYPLLKFSSEENADQRSLLGASLLLQTGFLAISCVLVVGTREQLAVLLNSKQLVHLLWYLPGMLLASLFRNTTLMLLQAKFKVKQVFWIDAVHFLGAPLLMFAAVRMEMLRSALDLVTINIVSLSTSSVVGLILARRLFRMTFRPRLSEIRRFWDYGKYSVGGLVSFMVYAKLDSFLLAAFSGPLQVALYNSVKVYTRVFDMMAQLIQTFVLPAASKLSSRGESEKLRTVAEKATMFGTLAMIPLLTGFLVLAPLLVRVYGEKYVDGVALLRIFAFASLSVPITHVAGSIILGLGHAKTVFLLNLKVLVFSLVAYLTLIPWLGAIGASLGFVLISCFYAVLCAFALYRFVPLTFRSTLSRTRDAVEYLRSRIGHA